MSHQTPTPSHPDKPGPAYPGESYAGMHEIDRQQAARHLGQTSLRPSGLIPYNRSYEHQRMAARVLAWHAGHVACEHAGCPDAALQRVAAERQAIEADNDTHREQIGQWLSQALHDSPHAGKVVRVFGRSKSLESAMSKIERRPPGGPEISDMTAFLVLLDDDGAPGPHDPKDAGPAMDVLHHLRGAFGAPETDVHGRQTVDVTRTDWSHPDFYCRMGKFHAEIDGEMVPFEVQVYHQDEYQRVYAATRDHYEAARPKVD